MQLQKQKSREYNNMEYFKHWIVIPNDIVEKLGWKAGDELKPNVKNKKLVIGKD
jgi:hypothetical protein